MINLSVFHGSYLFYLFLFFILMFIIQQFYYWFFFLRIIRFKYTEDRPEKRGISVVICARNEFSFLKENLPMILGQDYPDFEVVVVNHVSDDESSLLLNEMAETYPHLKIVEIREDLNFFSGKKFPLSIGIKSAKNEQIMLTEPACWPASPLWLARFGSEYAGSSEIILGHSSYAKKPGLLNKLLRFDNTHQALLYLSAALAGYPYRGSGKNMGYLKTLFYNAKGFISHYRISQGEDDLFINQVANYKNTRVVLHPDSFTISEPPASFRNWMIRKRRDLFTTRFYKFKDRLITAAYPVTAFFFYVVFILLLCFHVTPLLPISFMILRLGAQVYFIGSGVKKLNDKDLVGFIPLFDIILICINFSAWFLNLFSRKNRWR